MDIVEKKGKDSRQKLEEKYQDFVQILKEIDSKAGVNLEIRNLAKQYFKWQPLQVLNDKSNFTEKVNSWENYLNQLKKSLPD